MCMYIYITHIQAPVKLLYIPTSYYYRLSVVAFLGGPIALQ